MSGYGVAKLDEIEVMDDGRVCRSGPSAITSASRLSG
jgi:hypothetical protein